MKLVIEVSKEDYKRYKEDKVCSYASAVLDAVSLNEVLDEIKAEIEHLHHHPKLDFIKNDEVVDMVIEIIDKYSEVDE